MPSILVVEDKKSMAEMLKSTLQSEGYASDTASRGEDALEMLKKQSYDLVITDLKLPGIDGMALLGEVKAVDPFMPVIIMTAYGTIEVAVEAMKRGAEDFITKPFDIDHLLLKVRKALDRRKLERENILLREELGRSKGGPEIIGRSRAIKDVIEKIQKVAPTKSTVLLLGESGTGKELFAMAIHHLSPRKEGLFVPINCAAIPRELLESELFGHEKGAFTGATALKLGKFELANEGTIFLDEVCELELSLQAKLLRVLQDQQVERVGGTRPVQVDVRVIAASNKDLAEEVREGRFREDLYYRLNVFPVEIPPLRKRPDDIPLLVDYFIKRFSSEMGKQVEGIDDNALNMLIQYEWKGNVRELENTIERAMILADGDRIRKEHIVLVPVSIEASTTNKEVEGSLEDVAREAQRTAETRLIKRVLEETRWNKTRAAEILKVSYKTLLNKIKEYGLE